MTDEQDGAGVEQMGVVETLEEITDFEENCAACGVKPRVDGRRYCRDCLEGLVYD